VEEVLLEEVLLRELLSQELLLLSNKKWAERNLNEEQQSGGNLRAKNMMKIGIGSLYGG